MKIFSPARRRGFTLIELMVTIAIIGILMAAGVVAFTNAQRNARDAKRRADVDGIAKAFEQYYAANGAYPLTANIATALGSYFPSGMPTDPSTGAAYNNTSSATGDAFCTCATLENTTKGNASAGAAGVCTFAAASTLHCERNLQ